MSENNKISTGNQNPDGISRKQVRGSTLLLFGRLLSLGLNLLTQVLVIRYLSKENYGTFAYALAMVSMLTTISRLGMERTVARFVPIYEERHDLAAAAGTVILALGLPVVLGCAIIALFTGLKGLLTGTLIENPAVVSILLVLIALAPVTAVDDILQSLLSAFGRAGSIFFRKYILGPGLKLAAVSLTMLASGDVHMLAVGYVLASAVGLLLYGILTSKILQDHNLLRYFRPGMFNVRFRRLFRFAFPTFIADLAYALRPVVVVIVLEYFHNLSDVAEYRAVLPIARLNSVVLASFSLLFIPTIARLYAKNNHDMIGETQAHSALWVTVMTFPVFAVCISLAEPLIVLLIGERYSSSVPVLVILAVGQFFSSAFGMYKRTLRAIGKVRVLLYVEFISLSILLVSALELVPAYHAVGGAIAATVTMIACELMDTVALWRFTGRNPLPWSYARVYVVVAACSIGLWTTSSVLGVDSVIILVLLVVLAWTLVVLTCRNLLRVTEIFPETRRLPGLVRWVLGVNSTS